MPILRIGPLVLAALATALLVACTSDAQSAAPPETPAPTVSVAPALGRALAESRVFTGQLAAPHRVEIRPRVSGYIRAVAFEDGSRVQKGDLLFRIDARPFQAEVARLEAELAQHRAEYELAEKEAARAERLYRENAISAALYDSRASALKQAAAVVAATRARLAAARLDLQYTQITAPMSGRVSRAEVRVGGLVAAGETLLTTLVSTDRVHAYFHVDQQAYLAYQASLRNSGGDGPAPVYMGFAEENAFPFRGHVDFVDNALDAGTGTIRVRAVFDNPQQQLTPGLFVRLKLIAGEPREVVLVHDRAIASDLTHRFVYVVNGDNRVEYRRVTLGPAVGELRIISHGLRAGETVVVNGLQRVQPGVTVNPDTVAMASPSDLDALYAEHNGGATPQAGNDSRLSSATAPTPAQAAGS